MTNDKDFASPVTYQGAKGRLAGVIVDTIGLPFDGRFFDLCCGSGAVAVEAVRRGQISSSVVMVDMSPWGDFWRMIGNGTFDVDEMEAWCGRVPKEPANVKDFIEGLYREPVDVGGVYAFLLLQAATVGGAALWDENGRWQRSSGFRDLWLPTATSSRRSPVNPMMPMPDTILRRVGVLAEKMRGVVGVRGDAADVAALADRRDRVYIDPPYGGTTSYGYALDVRATATRSVAPCWVSEGLPLTTNAYRLSAGASKGGMTGDRKRSAHEEWLSVFSRDAS